MKSKDKKQAPKSKAMPKKFLVRRPADLQAAVKKASAPDSEGAPECPPPPGVAPITPPPPAKGAAAAVSPAKKAAAPSPNHGAPNSQSTSTMLIRQQAVNQNVSAAVEGRSASSSTMEEEAKKRSTPIRS